MQRADSSPSSSSIPRIAFLLVLGIAAAFILPQLQGTGGKSRTSPCDNTYVALNGRVAVDLDRVLHGLDTECGTRGGPQDVIDCVLGEERDRRNPNNEQQSAYATADEVIGNGSSCRVGLMPSSTNGVRFHQFVEPTSTTSRTFTVSIS